MVVKLTIKGVEEVIVLDEIKFKSADEFFEDLALGIPHGTIAVNWAEGVVFQHNSFPWTETTAREYIEKGRIYWASVKYAPMKDYKKSVSKNGVIFVIRKVRAPVLVEVAKELRKRLEEE